MIILRRIEILFTLILILGSERSYTQEQNKFKTKTTGLYIGISTNEIRESLLTNLIHTGPGLFTGFLKENKKSRIFKGFELLLSTNFPKSSFEEESSSLIIHLYANYKHLFNMQLPDSKFDLFLGGIASMETQFSYFENWDKNHFYWMTAYSLGVDLRTEYTIASHNIIYFEGNLPVLSMVSRPPEHFMFTQENSGIWQVTQKVHKNMIFSLPQKHMAINFQLGYTIKHSNKYRPSFFWQFNYLSNNLSSSKKMSQITNVLGVKLIF